MFGCIYYYCLCSSHACMLRDVVSRVSRRIIILEAPQNTKFSNFSVHFLHHLVMWNARFLNEDLH